MSNTRVISLRISSMALAQCTYILESHNIDPRDISLSSMVRRVVEAVARQYAEQNLVPEMTDLEAEERLGDIFKKAIPGLVVQNPEQLSFYDEPAEPPDPPGEIYEDAADDSCVVETVSEPTDLDSIRDGVHARLEPYIEQAKRQVDARRFFGVGSDATERTPSVRDIPPSYEPLGAPWDNVALGSALDLLAVCESCPIIAWAIKENEQLTLLAARAAIRQMPKDVLVTAKGEEVIKDVAKIYLDYVSDHPGTVVPTTVLPKRKDQKNGKDQSSSDSD